MKPLISATNQDGFVVRWLHPKLAEALQGLPEFGELTIVMHAAQPRTWKVERSYLFTQEDNRDGRPE